jgi:hypothetical protein
MNYNLLRMPIIGFFFSIIHPFLKFLYLVLSYFKVMTNHNFILFKEKNISEHFSQPHHFGKTQKSSLLGGGVCYGMVLRLGLIASLLAGMIAKSHLTLLPGVQKVGTAGTAGAGQTTFGWTK